MRILLTVHQFFPDHTNGTEVLTYQVARTLEQRGHEIRIVTGYPMKHAPTRERRFDQYEYRGLRVDRYYHQESAAVGEQANIAELEYDNHLCAGWLRSILNEWRPDVAHFFHLKNLSSSAIDICHDYGIPMVLTPTDFWLVCPTTQLLLPDGSLCNGPDSRGVNCLRHAITNTQPVALDQLFSVLPDTWVAGMLRASSWIVRAPFTWACALARRSAVLQQRASLLDCILAPTRLMEDVLKKNGIHPKRLVLCRFGIGLHGFAAASARRGSTENLRIGFIGSLAHPKGAHILIEALRRTPVAMPVELQVYGNPAVYPEYTEKLRQLAGDDPRISFRGTFPNETIGAVFANIDVFVVPSLWYENTPLVIYSAQAAGCPILASNLPGMAEVIRDGMDGLLFQTGDSAALAALITTLCLDRKMVGKLADNAPRPKSIEQYTDEVETTYQKLFARKDAAT
jgi:glycosyltransferase involved in cell wall biosynthesis